MTIWAEGNQIIQRIYFGYSGRSWETFNGFDMADFKKFVIATTLASFW
jgi:hypothetical protein